MQRNEPQSCSYSKRSSPKDVPDQSRISKAESRLQHLEQLVQDLVQSQSNSASSEPSHGVPHDGSNGSVVNGHAGYSGPTHYSAMLEDIEDLRQVLGEELELESASPSSTNEAIATESDVLFGGTPRLPLETILSQYLPPRVELDRRLAAYFRAEAIAIPYIHVPQFMRQYEQFCQDPMKTSPLWISMLFSICNLSQNVGRGAHILQSLDSGSSGTNASAERNFSLASAHCLAIGRYTKPQRFAVEALGLYTQARVVETLDPSRDIGILFGTLIQVAYTMGYHRDPSHFQTFSPFDVEMRRRAWSYCIQIDLLVSFMLGLPNNVQFGSWDTRPPSNYLDSDIEEHDAVLPPPRPDSEATKITFYAAKHMLMTIFDKILRHALSASARPEGELQALDAELRATYDSIPSVFHYKTVSQSVADPVYLVVTRKCVELMFQKCLCVLHRKHVTSGRLESVQICHDASKKIVSAFLELYPEFKPGGQFNDERWLLGSITWNDFLLGVMVLCLVLCQQMRIQSAGVEKQAEMVTLLRASKEVCEENLEKSLGARRTSRLLGRLLAQVERDGSALMTNGEGASAVSNGFSQNGHAPLEEDTSTVESGMQDWNSMVGWGDPWSNVFDTQEWLFLEECLNSNFEMQ